MKRAAWVLLLGAAGCAHTPAARAPDARPGAQDMQAYRYHHYETTGQMDYLVVDGKDAAIEFSADSDPRALALLHALRSEIFLPNCGGQQAAGGIYLVGRYDAGYSWAARLGRLLGGEPYHAFTLRRWYLARPVLKDVYGEDMARVRSVRLEKLRADDFDGAAPTGAELDALLRPGG